MEGLKIAKLTSGEFIIGRVLESGYITNAFKININFDQNTGQPNLNIIPLMFPISNDLNFFISIDKVICMSSANEKLQELYINEVTKIIQAQQEEQKLAENNQEENKETNEE